MRKIVELLMVILVCFAVNPALAQDTNEANEKMEQVGDQMDISAAITQVAEGISPDAFRGRFDMNEWKSKLSELEMTDISGLKENLRSLLDGLRNSSFAKDAKKDLYTELTGINGKADIKDFLGSLANGIEPDRLTAAFAKEKDDFLEGLKMMK